MSDTNAILDINFSATGFELVALPIIVISPIIIAELTFTNSAVKLFGGWLIPEHNVPGIGLVRNQWRRIYINQKQFINFPNLYTPNDYTLYFKASEWLAIRESNLKIYEVTG